MEQYQNSIELWKANDDKWRIPARGEMVFFIRNINQTPQTVLIYLDSLRFTISGPFDRKTNDMDMRRRTRLEPLVRRLPAGEEVIVYIKDMGEMMEEKTKEMLDNHLNLDFVEGRLKIVAAHLRAEDDIKEDGWKVLTEPAALNRFDECVVIYKRVEMENDTASYQRLKNRIMKKREDLTPQESPKPPPSNSENSVTNDFSPADSLLQLNQNDPNSMKYDFGYEKSFMRSIREARMSKEQKSTGIEKQDEKTEGKLSKEPNNEKASKMEDVGKNDKKEESKIGAPTRVRDAPPKSAVERKKKASSEAARKEEKKEKKGKKKKNKKCIIM